MPTRRHCLQPDVRTGVAWEHEQLMKRKESGRNSGTTRRSRSGTCLPRPKLDHCCAGRCHVCGRRTFSFEADNPVSLVKKTSALLQIVDEICEAHELLINMNDGKTEFSIERKGDGARQQFKRGEGTLHFPRRRVKVPGSCRATNMWAQSRAGHATRETMLKRKQTVHSRRVTNLLTLCSAIHVSRCISVNNL